MFEDIIEKEPEPKYCNKDALTENEFKILYCAICNIAKDCQFAAIIECMKECS